MTGIVRRFPLLLAFLSLTVFYLRQTTLSRAHASAATLHMFSNPIDALASVLRSHVRCCVSNISLPTLIAVGSFLFSHPIITLQTARSHTDINNDQSDCLFSQIAIIGHLLFALRMSDNNVVRLDISMDEVTSHGGQRAEGPALAPRPGHAIGGPLVTRHCDLPTASPSIWRRQGIEPELISLGAVSVSFLGAVGIVLADAGVDLAAVLPVAVCMVTWLENWLISGVLRYLVSRNRIGSSTCIRAMLAFDFFAAIVLFASLTSSSVLTSPGASGSGEGKSTATKLILWLGLLSIQLFAFFGLSQWVDSNMAKFCAGCVAVAHV